MLFIEQDAYLYKFAYIVKDKNRNDRHRLLERKPFVMWYDAPILLNGTTLLVSAASNANKKKKKKISNKIVVESNIIQQKLMYLLNEKLAHKIGST